MTKPEGVQMKYFGKKSLSSVVHTILHIAWWAVLYISIFAAAVFALLLFSRSSGNWITAHVAKISPNSNWQKIYTWPLIVKVIALPYVAAVVVLQLQMIKKAQQLFANFTNNIVFNKSNVQITSMISKMLIAYSILTADLTLFVVSIILLIVCAIIKNGTALQEEHDLTV
jgi:hypothetical protein